MKSVQVSMNNNSEDNILELMLSSMKLNREQVQATEMVIYELIKTKNEVQNIKDDVINIGKEYKEEIEKIAEDVKDNIYVSPAELGEIREAAKAKIKKIISRRADVSYKKAAINLWNYLYTMLGVSKYFYIKRKDKNFAIELISNYTYKK